MPLPAFDQVLGTIGRHRVTVRAADGSPVTDFLPSDPLSAVLWAGDDDGSIVAPDVAWVDAAAGVFSLTITSAMTAGFSPGVYRVQAFVTPTSDGERRCLLDGSVRFLPTAGIDPAAEPAPTYASYEDLLDYCPDVDRLQREQTDLAGFAEQRARARTWYDEAVVRMYHPVPGRCRRMLDAAGDGPGPYPTFADPPEGATIPTDVELQAILDADGLAITDQIRECVSHKAAAIAYRAVASGAYREEAAGHDREASRLWWIIMPEVKSDPDLDAPDLRIGRDVTFLT